MGDATGQVYARYTVRFRITGADGTVRQLDNVVLIENYTVFGDLPKIVAARYSVKPEDVVILSAVDATEIDHTEAATRVKRAAEQAKRYMDGDTDFDHYCVVPNHVVKEIMRAAEGL